MARQTCLPSLGRAPVARRKLGSLPPADPRERIERAAYELFSRHGIRAVGVDTIAAQAGVAKMTLYRSYPSKEALALAFLGQREERWTRTWLQREVERRGGTAADNLLAVFDVFDRWFRRPDFEACAFARVLLEGDKRAHPIRRATLRHLGNIRSVVRRWAGDAGVSDPDGFARQWQILMMGSIVAAYAGDREAAQRAKAVAVHFLAGDRAAPRKGPGHNLR